jgi:hypothetical protein
MKPRIEIITMQSNQSIMIPVSGTTTPEESQAKEGMWSDEEDDLWNTWHPDLWDEE